MVSRTMINFEKENYDIKLQTSLPYELTFLTEKQFCQITGQKVATARSNRIKGKGCGFYKIGGSIRYKLSEVVEYLENCKRNSTTMIVYK